MPAGETKTLLLRKKVYPVPLSFAWRVTHFIPYLIGGSTFFIGSLCYFTTGTVLAGNYELGGWLFTIGSVGFLFADIFEWNTNNRIGCWDNSDERKEWEQLNAGFASNGKKSALRSLGPAWVRAENGINFAQSALGSLLYLIGSVLFIPELDAIVLGTYIFIVGSAVIFTSQAWKLYRYESYSDDVPAVNVDAWAGIGGVAYCVGSVKFLPAYDLNDAATNTAAAWFTLGGLSFFLSGLFIYYRYFVASPPMYETA